MVSVVNNLALDASRLSRRTDELFAAFRHRVCSQTDRLFMWMMVAQWIFGAILAVVVSPRTWIGETPYVHIHTYAAIIFGTVLSAPPIFMAWRYPGAVATRHTIAVAQGAWTCFLIHLTGGRIETHFHAFGSLAFLVFYRDWKVLISASVVMTVDHVIRGSVWPESVYGVSVDSTYRFIEHAGWLIWVDVFLVISCFRHHREAREVATRRAVLEVTNEEIEERIDVRTDELRRANEQLERTFEEKQAVHLERERLYRDLANASHAAGMADVATGVLHNVGNVLNSVNVSANLVREKLHGSRVDRLKQASDVIDDHLDEIGRFLEEDEKGKHFPRLLNRLAATLRQERDENLKEVESLVDNISHVKEVIGMQQALARKGGAIGPVDVEAVIENALKINATAIECNGINVVKQFDELPEVLTDRNKVLQILVNLVSNATDALSMSENGKTMTISLRSQDELLRIEVRDDGTGVAKEHVARIFQHGFTTKPHGHGFGLHSSANAANSLGGSLSVSSEGTNQGARFTLTIPVGEEVPCLT